MEKSESTKFLFVINLCLFLTFRFSLNFPLELKNFRVERGGEKEKRNKRMSADLTAVYNLPVKFAFSGLCLC